MGQEPQVLSVRKDAHRDLRNLTANQGKANGLPFIAGAREADFAPASFAPPFLPAIVFLTGPMRGFGTSANTARRTPLIPRSLSDVASIAALLYCCNSSALMRTFRRNRRI
jgi:hypothetical protein